MLLRWDSQHPGQTVPIQAPYPSWDGVYYTASNTTDVPTFKTGLKTDFLKQVSAPVAVNDAAVTPQGTPVKLALLGNDSCVGGCDPASVLVMSAPANGSAVASGDGTVSYTPNGSFQGSDHFSYTMADTSTGQRSNLASVTVTVGSAPSASKPFATHDTASTVQGTVAAIDVVANDSNCPPCSVTIVSPPLHGSAVANSPATGQVSYTPAAGYTGADSFSYTASNAAGTSNVANVDVTVVPNPVTDVVSISSASLAKNGSLQLKGSVSRLNSVPAASVEVFSGGANASGTGCVGTLLGSAAVNQQAKWSFSAKPVSAGSVCVHSANGGVAVAPL